MIRPAVEHSFIFFALLYTGNRNSGTNCYSDLFVSPAYHNSTVTALRHCSEITEHCDRSCSFAHFPLKVKWLWKTCIYLFICLN